MEKYNLSIKSDLIKYLNQYGDEKLFKQTDYQKSLAYALNNNKKLKFLQSRNPNKKYYFTLDPASKEGDKGCTVISHKEMKNGVKIMIIDNIEYND